MKFSYAWLAGMVFAEHDTAASVSYSNTLCTDPDLMEFAKKVVVEADASIADSATSGTIRTTDGRLLAFRHDLAAPLVSGVIEQRLRHKARALAGLDKAEKFWDAAALSEHTDARALGALLRE